MLRKLLEALKQWGAEHPRVAGLGLAALVVSIIFGSLIPLLLFTVGLLVAYLPIQATLLSSVSARIIIAVTIVFALFQMEALIFWATGMWVSSTHYVVATLGIVILLIAKTNNALKPAYTLRPWFELVVIAPCLLIGGLYLARVLAPPSNNDVAIVRAIDNGMDDATHAHMFTDMLRYDNNLLSGESRKELLSRPSTMSYPMGWHLTTGIVTNSLINTQGRTAMENVRTYFYAKVASVVYAIAALSLLVAVLIWRLNKGARNYEVALLGIVAALFTSFIVTLPLFYEGFFSFLPILAFTPLFAALLVDAKPTPVVIGILGLLSAVSSTTWVLTGPILLLALVLYLAPTIGHWRKIPWYAYASVGLGAAAFIAQAGIVLSRGKKMVTQLADLGGIMAPEHMLLLAGIAGIAILIVIKNKVWNETARLLGYIVFSFGAALALVLLYITTENNEITYYYSKIQSALLVILVALLTVLVASAVLRLSAKEKDFVSHWSMLAIMPVLLILAIPGVVGYTYFYNAAVHRTFAYTLTAKDAAIVAKGLDRDEAKENDRRYFAFPGNAPLNILGSNTIRIAHPLTDCDYRVFDAVYDYDLPRLDKELVACTPTLPTVTIYTNKDGAQQLRDSLEPNLLDAREVNLVVL